MLIDCRECGHDVSSHAMACPNCGYGKGGPAMGKIRTELTGKSLKAFGLIGHLLFLSGVVSFIFLGIEIIDDFNEVFDVWLYHEERYNLAVYGTPVGFGMKIVYRFMSWWHHG